MDGPILTEILGIGIIMLLGAMLLGYFLGQRMGLFLAGIAAALAVGLSVLATALAGQVGLFIAMLIVGLLGAGIGSKLGEARGARLIGLMWFGFCFSCLIGHWVGGRVGLLTVTLPAHLLFWLTLYHFSGYLLPLRDPAQRTLAFRALLTFSLGTNYPYHVMKGHELQERVKGNPAKAFFAGPGIIITDCDHVAVTTKGTNIRLPESPGLAFTEKFDLVHSVVDLRPQLRAFEVEARTLDGISIHVLTFIAFRIHWGGQEPALGRPFPFQQRAIFQALTGEVVDQQAHKNDWKELVDIYAAPIMRDIICRYKFDDLRLALGPPATGSDDIALRYAPDRLTSPDDPKMDPRSKIGEALIDLLRKEMTAFGVEVLAGGIGNLAPSDEGVIQQRISNWRARWEDRIKRVQADGETRRASLLEAAQSQVELELLDAVRKILKDKMAKGADMSEELLAATFVASLERMAENPAVKDKLPQATKHKVAVLGSMARPLVRTE